LVDAVRWRAKNDLLSRQEVAVLGSPGLRQEVTRMVNDREGVVLDRLRVGSTTSARSRARACWKGSANTQRGAERFVDELIARVRRAGATGEILMRADSIGVRLTKPVAAAIEAIPEEAWRRLHDYPETGEAEIAETTLGDERLIVRRVRTLVAQQQLFATGSTSPSSATTASRSSWWSASTASTPPSSSSSAI
jgi:hypothetical protein